MAPVDAATLLERAAAAGVEWLVCPGTDAAGSRAARRLAGEHPDRVLWAAGLHPHDAVRWEEERDEIAALAAGATAIGEIGLDFYRDLSPRDDQLAAFRDQVALGEALDKPLVVHIRDAFADVHRILEVAGAGPRTILHCWSGGPKWARRFLDLGVVFSFAGPITYPGGDAVRRAAALVPPERAMVETDTPYLTPPPDRRAPNEPANVVKVGEALAEVWGVDPGTVAAATSATAARVFRRG
jgi:TatD DNase family protein